MKFMEAREACEMVPREKCDFGAEIAVSDSVSEYVLHWPMPHGKEPLGSEQFCCKEL